MKNCKLIVAALAASCIAAANAEFVVGNMVEINGTAYGAPGQPLSMWGGQVNEGPHSLGGLSQYFDPNIGPAEHVLVSSTVVDPYSVIFHFDFHHFNPGIYAFHTIDILGLKSDGSIIDVAGNTGGFSWDGNSVHWEGSGEQLAALGALDFKVFQSPAPGAGALLGIAGLTASRRRRV